MPSGKFYNNSVLLYNTRIQSIPANIVAFMLGYRKKEYFKATEDERKKIEVNI
ncbi:MAG: LemA family protein [Candidatus Micrarchaeia archaeon]